MNDRAPQLLADLGDTTAALLVKQGMDADKAAAVSIELVDWIRTAWGGELIYIPQGCAIDIARRDMEIFEKFNGRNHNDLAREYNVSVVHIYRIVKLVRAAELKKRQGDLFREVSS